MPASDPYPMSGSTYYVTNGVEFTDLTFPSHPDRTGTFPQNIFSSDSSNSEPPEAPDTSIPTEPTPKRLSRYDLLEGDR